MYKMFWRKSAPLHLMAVSAIAFILVNLTENLLHYNIGRASAATDEVAFYFPTQNDWIRIILVMIFFSVMQGGFTLLLNRYL